MITLGTICNTDVLQHMIFVDTLIYFEGPLLELYIDKIDHNRYYLCRWVDDDERRNRWTENP